MAEINAHSEVGEAYLRSLTRAQFNLAMRCLAMLVVSVGACPLAFELVPWLRTTAVLGVPIAWLMLGVFVYPILIAIAAFYVHRAERNEASFLALVRDRTGEPQ